MIITIDGPAGAGKSTVARRLAERLGFEFLDTGALYRMATLAASRAGIAPVDTVALAALLGSIQLDLRDGQAFLDGTNVAADIRTPEITRQIQGYADSPIVREYVTARTRELARERDVVTEGRDQGSVVFPDADKKFYLTASDEVRAQRRFRELAAKGLTVKYEDVLADQRRRDQEDASRPIGALVKPEGAIVVESSGMDAEDVIARMVRLIRPN